MIADEINKDNRLNQEKMEVIMDEKVIQIRATMFKHRIKSYQVSKELNIPDCTLSRMLNGHIKMTNKVYGQIMDYLKRFECNKCEVATR